MGYQTMARSIMNDMYVFAYNNCSMKNKYWGSHKPMKLCDENKEKTTGNIKNFFDKKIRRLTALIWVADSTLNEGTKFSSNKQIRWKRMICQA